MLKTLLGPNYTDMDFLKTDKCWPIMIILKITWGSYWSKFIRFQEFGIRVNEA